MKKNIFNAYVKRIIKEFSITRDMLFDKNKGDDFSHARHLLYWACSVDGGFRNGTIVRMMKENGYDTGHSTIAYGINKMQATEDSLYMDIKDKICLG